jgi:hypothetical protein
MRIRADEYFSAFELVGSPCLGCNRSEKYEIYIDASIKSFLKMIGRTPIGLGATKRRSSRLIVKFLCKQEGVEAPTTTTTVPFDITYIGNQVTSLHPLLVLVQQCHSIMALNNPNTNTPHYYKSLEKFPSLWESVEKSLSIHIY